MSIIQQPTLFDLDILSQLDVTERHAEIFSLIDFLPLVQLFQKENKVGAPITLNYEAAIRALISRYLESIPTIKVLVKRLNEDVAFKLSLGFLYSERISSEASFSRIMKRLACHMKLLFQLNHTLLRQINQDFQIFEEPVALDATAVQAHTHYQSTENSKRTKTAEQREKSTAALLEELPTYPSWSVKTNSQGKHNYWFGYKSHFSVAAHSQYLLTNMTTSAFVADISLAIPTIRKLKELGLTGIHVLMDKAYDGKAVYEEAHFHGFEPIIDLKKQAKHGCERDDDYHSTCLLEYSYHYDSFDKRYGTLKFIRPKNQCYTCLLQHEDICQKVIKIKQSTNVRGYQHPARGTLSWKKIYALRSSVERVNAVLKENYLLGRTTYFNEEHVLVEHQLIQLAYNAKTYAVQRLTSVSKLVA